MHPKARIALGVLLGLAALAGSGCTVMSTGARSAVVVLVRRDVSNPSLAGALEIPPRPELQSVLSPHFLWLTDDKRAAQWIAYVDVHAPPTPLQPFDLTVLEIRKNPAWAPENVSDPIATRDGGMHPSLRLAEQNQQSEASRGSKD